MRNDSDFYASGWNTFTFLQYGSYSYGCPNLNIASYSSISLYSYEKFYRYRNFCAVQAMTWGLSPVLFMEEGREVAETVEKRFRRMEQYLEGLVQELEALQSELPGFGYEIRNIGMKTHEVQRNIQYLRRKTSPPGGGSDPRVTGSGEEASRDAREMARDLHRFLSQCKEYMGQMEEVDPSFASYRTDLRILFNQAQDRLQQYWERDGQERKEPFIQPLVKHDDRNQKDHYEIPSFMEITKGMGEA
jgi:hypothetical protein